jgi:hypothetical protein
LDPSWLGTVIAAVALEAPGQGQFTQQNGTNNFEYLLDDLVLHRRSTGVSSAQSKHPPRRLRRSKRINQWGFVIKLPLCACYWLIGNLAIFHQLIALFTVALGLNISTVVIIILFPTVIHAMIKDLLLCSHGLHPRKNAPSASPVYFYSQVEAFL